MHTEFHSRASRRDIPVNCTYSINTSTLGILRFEAKHAQPVHGWLRTFRDLHMFYTCVIPKRLWDRVYVCRYV